MRKIIHRILLTLLTIAVALDAEAQGYGFVKRGCLPDGGVVTRGIRRQLPAFQKEWDASRLYPQMVVLVSFSDLDFKDDDPCTFYDQILNSPGYNEGKGPGSMTDYFREQSGGLFNLRFDVYGPFKMSTKSHIENSSSGTTNYGTSMLRKAMLQMVEANPELDYSQYDWNGDGIVEQVIFIAAGYSGNQGEGSYGYLWPNTSSFSTVTTPDGLRIYNYSASAELWLNDESCGIGTVCHEYSHSLGLPDIYPTGGSTGFYSVCDEWDLMDGGNFTNYGWCPPNYSSLEKILLGWLSPIELTEPTEVTGMKPVSEGGETYMIRHTDDEYYLLENRQHTGWDAGLPGQGLLITHVDYNQSAWQSNTVNNTKGHFRYDFVHADNLDYEQWDKIQPRNASQYAGEDMMNNKHLSTTAYPWSSDTGDVNDLLTDTSTPASIMYGKNTQGNTSLSKAITNIRMSADGLISFDFMGGDPSAIRVVSQTPSDDACYNLQGQRVVTPRSGLYIRNGKKIVIH